MTRDVSGFGIGTVRRYLAATAGNITVILALSLMVLVGGAGAAIDYARLYEQKTAYAAAADAAVLAAISSATEAEKKGLGGIKKLAEDAAQKAWVANIMIAGYQPQKMPNIKITQVGNDWTAVIDYNERLPTTFMGLVGVKGMRLSGTASAGTTISKDHTFWDFHVVVDDSSSMGIGATQADMDALQAAVGCTFACHWADYAAGETDYVTTAKAQNIRLRIDIVDDAVDAMLNEMIASATGNNVRAKLWGLNDDAKAMVELTAKLADVRDYNIQLYKTPVSVGNTNYESSLSTLKTEIGKAGQGKSAVDPKKAVFIVTDGIHDTGFPTGNTTYTWYSDHVMGTVDPAACQALKDNGVIVGVLYIDYITPAGYEGAIDPVKPDVLPRLESCATTGLFFNATSPDGITKAMKEMLAMALGIGDVRLTD